MKKSITLLLSLALSIGAISALTACETEPAHTHSYVDGVCSCGETDPNATTPPPVSYTVTETEWNASFNLGSNFTLTAQFTMDTTTYKYTEKRAGNIYQSSAAQYDNGELVRESGNFFKEENGVTFYYIPHYSTEDELEYYDIETRNETLDELVADIWNEYFPEPFQAYSSYTYNETTKQYEVTSVNVGSVTVTNVTVSFENKKVTRATYQIDREGTAVTYTVDFTYGNTSITLPTNVQGALAPGYDQPATDSQVSAITAEQLTNAFNFGTNYSVDISLVYPASANEEDENYYAKRNGYLFETGDDEYTRYYEYDDGSVYKYNPGPTANDPWTKVRDQYADLSDLENMVMEEFLNPAFTVLSNFTYDSTKVALVAQELSVEMYGQPAVYSNVEITLTKLLKISKIEYDLAYGTNAAHFTFDFTYGTAIVTLPTNVQGGSGGGIGGGGVSKPDYSDYQIKDDYYWTEALAGGRAEKYECNMRGYIDGNLTNHQILGVTNYIILMQTVDSEDNLLGLMYMQKAEENSATNYYIYDYDPQTESWSKSLANEAFWNTVNMTQFTSAFDNFEAFEFNEQILAYEQTGELTFQNTTITNALLRFENGKLVYLSYTVSGGQGGQSFTQDVEIEISYSETIYYDDQLPTDYTDNTQGNN